ncbi:MAG: alpha/beta hydrolase [Myxococcales bacterium]|nr:alpha/beta hydrolase [Myxococcales bacterium]
MAVSSSLHVEVVCAAAAVPLRYALVLHGVFGSAANWRLFARKLALRCPSWGFLLADLRGHGRSLGLAAPHAVADAARDLLRLEHAELGIDGPIDGVIGHSLGGKIALAYAGMRPDALAQVWLLDSQPSADAATRSDDDGSATPRRVLAALEALPPRFAARAEFDAALAARGFAPDVIAWLRMNVRRDGGGYVLGLDLLTIRALLADYFRLDLSTELGRVDARRELHVVVAGRSAVWSAPARARLAALAQSRPRVFAHTLADAGHWLHVDAPEPLLELMAAAFS